MNFCMKSLQIRFMQYAAKYNVKRCTLRDDPSRFEGRSAAANARVPRCIVRRIKNVRVGVKIFLKTQNFFFESGGGAGCAEDFPAVYLRIFTTFVRG